MKPIKQGVPGHTHTFAVRRDTPTDKVFPAGVDPGFSRGPSRGVSSPGAAARGRIEMPMD